MWVGLKSRSCCDTKLIEIGYRNRREKFREKEGRKGSVSLCSNQYVFNNQCLVMDNS